MHESPKKRTRMDAFRYRWRRMVGSILEDGVNDGLGGPPNSWQRLAPFASDRGMKDARKVYARFDNDAFDVAIGESWVDGGQEFERWCYTLPAPALRRIALWYLWRWVWGEWFGLRRRLYFWNLSRRVAAMQAWRKANRPED